MQVKDFHGQNVIDSREVAAMVEKNHKDLLRDIRGYIDVMENPSEDAAQRFGGERNFAPSDFFIPSTYRVVWCSQEGIQQERSFDNLQDACIEYFYVNEHYDGADILDENGNPVRWEKEENLKAILSLFMIVFGISFAIIYRLLGGNKK